MSSEVKRAALLSTADVAMWLGLSPRTLCLWAECCEIPAIKIGRHWRFDESELRRWVRNKGRTKLLRPDNASSRGDGAIDQRLVE